MKNQNQNLLVAVAIWLACMFGLYLFFPDVMGAKKPPAQQKPSPVVQSPPPTAAPPVSPTGTGPAAAPQAADVPRGTEPTHPLRTVTFETARERVVATSEGAAIQSVQLLGEKWTLHKGTKEEANVDLVPAHAGEPLPFTTVVQGENGAALVPASASYELVRSDKSSATFRTAQGGVTVTKTLSVSPENYGISLVVEVKSDKAVSGHLAVISGAHAAEPSGGFFAPHSNVPARTICAAGNDKVERVAIGAKHPVFEAQAAQFAGIDEQYFLNAVLAPAGVPTSCRLEAQGEKAGSLSASLLVPLQVPAGGEARIAFQGYAGPKSDAELLAVGKPLKLS
ncbi:MAG TPA: membrane protein insertase YidC, partial [Myxococcales bacterium]|nr:membrane protein insertase YidC [Myxococcales bacterium]